MTPDDTPRTYREVKWLPGQKERLDAFVERTEGMTSEEMREQGLVGPRTTMGEIVRQIRDFQARYHTPEARAQEIRDREALADEFRRTGTIAGEYTMTHQELLASTFATLGIPFKLTDDSEESPGWDDIVNTVIVIEERYGPVCFLFRRDGSFKDVIVFGHSESGGMVDDSVMEASDRDMARIQDAIENPREPSESARRAVERYRDGLESEPTTPEP